LGSALGSRVAAGDASSTLHYSAMQDELDIPTFLRKQMD